MIYINNIVVEKDGHAMSVMPIQAANLDEALDELYNGITANLRR